MADNILKKQLGCISEDFLRGVFGRVGKPMWRALAHMFVAVTTGKSTLVTDISRTLRADSSRAEAKRAEEKVSGWLARWDFAGPLNPWLLGKASECASDDETYAVCPDGMCATDFLRKARGFKKVLKHLSDNLEAVSMKTHALLAGIRALVNETKLRFISGRPPKTSPEAPMQMLLAL